jgi:hypothetical protein
MMKVIVTVDVARVIAALSLLELMGEKNEPGGQSAGLFLWELS